jgi:hypothetical protein
VPSAQYRHSTFITRLRNLERMREITEVAVRHGFGFFFERHRLYGLLRFGGRKRPPAPSQRGRHIREMLDELGPTFVKFGQLLSTRPDIVPADKELRLKVLVGIVLVAVTFVLVTSQIFLLFYLPKTLEKIVVLPGP